MERTVYYHLGMGRCGSSAIQRFAAGKHDALLGRGICYPRNAELGYPRHRLANGHPLALDDDGPDAVIAAMVRYIDASLHDKFLFSSEFLYTKPQATHLALRRALEAIGVRLVAVAYVREQREWMISRYAQAVKTKRLTESLQDFLAARGKRGQMDYNGSFRSFVETFGRENFVPRIFRRALLHGGDVRSDMFHIAGCDVTDLLDEDTDTNASASILELEALRTINIYYPKGPFNSRVFLRLCSQLCEEKGWAQSHDLYRLAEPRLLRKMGLNFRSANKELQHEFFPEIEGPLFGASIPEKYELATELERFSERSIAFVLHYYAQRGRLAETEKGEEMADSQG